jgi:hypothetical protein
MTFNIYAVDTGDAMQARYEIVLGDYKENGTLITTLWTREAYEKQWFEALSSLVDGLVQRCVLVTDVQPCAISGGITYWAVFKEGDLVYFQERWKMNSVDTLLGDPGKAEPNIEPRIQGTPEEHSRVSEWNLPFEYLRQFRQIRAI